MTGPQLTFRRFTVGYYPINGFLLADPDGVGIFIDPGGFEPAIARFIEQHAIQLKAIFITHGHRDHIEGLGPMKDRYNATCYAPEGEVDQADHTLHGGEQLEVGSLRFATFSTPGHSRQAIAYYCPPRLFPGDALFCGSVGGTSTPRDAKLQIDRVREHLFSLPDETEVYPAHGPMTTLAAEKYANPFFLTP